MTNEQIKARCDEAAKSVTFLFYEKVIPTKYLESMYREAMAAGLEMAAGKADKYPCNPEARRGMASLADWCREQAQAIKGGGK